MKLLEMGDSSTPQENYGDLPVYAFYGHGDTPHVWTPAEVAGITSRWALPISVQTDPNANAEADAAAFAEQLARYKWTKGVSVALDTEDVVMPEYVKSFDHFIQGHGYVLVHYESQSVQAANGPTTGGAWVAAWPGVKQLPPGAVAHQYANAADNGTPWDASVISNAVRLHELNPVVAPAFVDCSIAAMMPALRQGDRGYSVRALQALLAAAMPEAAGPLLSDGIFGQDTLRWVAHWQHLYGVTDPAGVAAAGTWESLLTRS